jgi:hypothetical protein
LSAVAVRGGTVTRSDEASTDRLHALTDRLLVRDADAHAAALAELAEVGDDRVIPHLVEVVVIDGIAGDWGRFGFPTALRGRDPPRYLDLPEVRWPGVRDTLAALAEPSFDSDHAWVEWETWYSQQELPPLAGFEDWKLRLYRSYLPPVGGLLDCEPRAFDVQSIRWGNCDRSFLAALNAPAFVPGEAVSTASDAAADASEGEAADDAGPDPERYLADDAVVFGFELGGTAYAVPRWVLFPHELLNAELDGHPVSLTYCTLCNAPILYDRRVDGDLLTFGSSGMLAAGNKVMYDEETETLWDQHAGAPIGGPYRASHPDLYLDQFAVTQTTWGEWREAYPGSLALDLETGYDYDYRQYEGDVGFFDAYWTREDVIQPGVRRADGPLAEKASVYGLTDGDEAWVIPVDDVAPGTVLTAEVAGRPVVAIEDETGDVAVYEAPPTPVEWTDAGLVDADGVEWTVTRDALQAPSGGTRARVPGRHGLWFAFRTHYGTTHVVRAAADD